MIFTQKRDAAVNHTYYTLPRIKINSALNFLTMIGSYNRKVNNSLELRLPYFLD